MAIMISVIGALSAFVVSVVSALLANKNNNNLQLRKLKEEHYISYVEAAHNLASNNKNVHATANYTRCRDKLLVVGSEEVVYSILKFEKEAIGKECEFHNIYFTDVIKAIRRDLKIKDKDYPQVSMIK